MQYPIAIASGLGLDLGWPKWYFQENLDISGRGSFRSPCREHSLGPLGSQAHSSWIQIHLNQLCVIKKCFHFRRRRYKKLSCRLGKNSRHACTFNLINLSSKVSPTSKKGLSLNVPNCHFSKEPWSTLTFCQVKEKHEPIKSMSVTFFCRMVLSFSTCNSCLTFADTKINHSGGTKDWQVLDVFANMKKINRALCLPRRQATQVFSQLFSQNMKLLKMM